ncbi:MAG: hypothetical protein AAGF88_07295 [Pseudomonadota bacterium]
MAIRILMMLGLCLLVAACGTRLNPFNWFGGAEDEERVETIEAPESTDPRLLVAQVLDVTIDPLPTGAVVTAIGLPPTQGFWEAELVEVSRSDGRLVYEFRVFPPLTTSAPGSQASREVITAADLSVRDLDGIREIAVEGASNRLVSRR